MTEPRRRYGVTITVARDGDRLLDPAEFAVTAQQAAPVRVASIVTAHTAGQIISVVTVRVVDHPQRPRPSPGCCVPGAAMSGRITHSLTGWS